MEHLSQHEPDDGEVAGSETHEHGHQHHQGERAGPPVAAFLAPQRVFPGCPAQLQGDLHVTEQYDPRWPTEAYGTGHQDDEGQPEDSLNTVLLHTGRLACHGLGHGDEEQGCRLQRRQGPDSHADEPRSASAAELGAPVGADHSQVTVHAHARHEVDPPVGVHVEDERHQPAEPFTKRPAEVQRVVSDPSRQGQREQEVRHCQLDQVDAR